MSARCECWESNPTPKKSSSFQVLQESNPALQKSKNPIMNVAIKGNINRSHLLLRNSIINNWQRICPTSQLLTHSKLSTSPLWFQPTNLTHTSTQNPPTTHIMLTDFVCILCINKVRFIVLLIHWQRMKPADQLSFCPTSSKRQHHDFSQLTWDTHPLKIQPPPNAQHQRDILLASSVLITSDSPIH